LDQSRPTPTKPGSSDGNQSIYSPSYKESVVGGADRPSTQSSSGQAFMKMSFGPTENGTSNGNNREILNGAMLRRTLQSAPTYSAEPIANQSPSQQVLAERTMSPRNVSIIARPPT